MVRINWVYGSNLLSGSSRHREVRNAFKSHTQDVIPDLSILFARDSAATWSTFPTSYYRFGNTGTKQEFGFISLTMEPDLETDFLHGEPGYGLSFSS